MKEDLICLIYNKIKIYESFFFIIEIVIEINQQI
jgi:hypothetical protein